MLAELAAANAAFQIIKKTVQNTGDLAKAGRAISDFVIAKEELQRKGQKKKKSGVRSSDLEEFMALEQIREAEAQLKQIMIYTGRAGLHGDFLKYQADARKARKAAQLKAQKEREEMIETVTAIVGIGIGVTIVIGALGALIYYVKGF